MKDNPRLDELLANAGSTDIPTSRASELKRENKELRRDNKFLRQDCEAVKLKLEDETDELMRLLLAIDAKPALTRLLRYLWTRRSAYVSDLCGPEKPWPDEVEQASITTAVRRLNNALASVDSRYSVTLKNEVVRLNRPDDK